MQKPPSKNPLLLAPEKLALSPFPFLSINSWWKRNLACQCFFTQNHSRRLRSCSRKFRSVPEAGADFPAAIFLAGKCPNLGKGSTSCCRRTGEEFSSGEEICWNTLPARNFGQPQAHSLLKFSDVPSPFPVSIFIQHRITVAVVVTAKDSGIKM